MQEKYSTNLTLQICYYKYIILHYPPKKDVQIKGKKALHLGYPRKSENTDAVDCFSSGNDIVLLWEVPVFQQ